MTAEAVLQRALAGDRAATRRLVDLLTPVIQARVARIVLRRAAAGRGRDIRQEVEDLSQDVFVALFDDRGAILRAWSPDKGLSLVNYAGLVAERRTLNALNSRRKSPWTEDPTAPADLPVGGAHAESAARVEARSVLGVVLDRLRASLSPKGLHLFELLMVKQRSVDDTCAATGMTPSAVYAWRSRLGRQAREIRDALLAEGNDTPGMTS